MYGDTCSCNAQGQLQIHNVIGPALFRADSSYLQKSRSDLNKGNRRIATAVVSYICIMIQT